MTPFFDPRRCPICVATLPVQPLRCPACGVDLRGPAVAELAETLRRADLLADGLRAQMQTAPVSPDQSPSRSQGQSQGQPHPAPQPRPSQPRPPAGEPAARFWLAGRSAGVIVLMLGALCVLAAGAVFIAVEWMLLPLAIRSLTLIVVTASFGLFAQLALGRGLAATAEAMAVTACGMFVLDLTAARRAGLLGLGELADPPYAIVVGVLLVAVAGAGAFSVRRAQHWLQSLDAAVALGMAVAASGALSWDIHGYGVPAVTVTVVLCVLYLVWRRVGMPVAMWSAGVLGAVGWLTAVEVGAVQAADHVGADAGRLASAWPALAVALVAGIWSIRLSNEMWRRSAACLCLMPVLLVFEIVGWSHGWIVGTVVMLAGYVVAALASGHVPSLWSPAVGVSALVLALSSVAGLLPAMVRLAARLERPFGPLTGDVAPWLLPLTTSAVLALLPQVTIGSRRLRVDWRNAAGAFVATLGVLPLLWGASFWVSFTVLVMVAVLLLVIAGQWRSDVVLVLGLSLLAIMGIFARHGDLADPLAWTIIALACLAWATIEPRLTVWLGFLTTSGLFALLAVAQWLTFAQVPRSFHGLVVVVVGSIGLLGSQWFLASPGLPQRATARLVGERLCVVWMVVGLAMAESSPSHHALELTVAGVAAGITSQVSPDRRPAGWASGVLLTIASWVRLADSDIQVVEWYTLPAATALLVYGTRRLRADTSESSLRCLGPGLTLALVPSLLLALDEPVSWRGLAVGLASVALVALGSHARLAAPFALGVTGTALLALRNIWPVAAFVPRWTLLFLIGGVLLATGMTWESRVRDARTASRYVRGLH